MAIIRRHKMALTTVVNIKTGMDCDVYIGRGSLFGNPYRIGRNGNRKEVVKKYKIYFYKKIRTNPKFKHAVLKLKGKRLGCFCWPSLCHGDVIVEYLRKVTA